MKHVNDKVIITVYVYNKTKSFLIYKLKKIYESFIMGNKTKNLAKKKRNNIGKAVKKFALSIFRNKKTVSQNELFTGSKNVYNITKLSKFSSKRFKKKQMRYYIPKIKMNRNLYYNRLTKLDLSRFIARLLKKKANPNSDGNPLGVYSSPAYQSRLFSINNFKYENLIKKYIFLLDNDNINTMNKKYFSALKYVSLLKYKTKEINTEHLTKPFRKKSPYLSNISKLINVYTKKCEDSYLSKCISNSNILINVYTKLSNDSNLRKAISNSNILTNVYTKSCKDPNLTLQLTRNISKKGALFYVPAKTLLAPISRNDNIFMHKLRNLHKLFFLSKTKGNVSNSAGITLTESSSSSKKQIIKGGGELCAKNLDLTNINNLKVKNFLVKNLDKILKKKTTFLKVLNVISLKGLRIVKKARRNREFLFKILE